MLSDLDIAGSADVDIVLAELDNVVVAADPNPVDIDCGRPVPELFDYRSSIAAVSLLSDES